MNMFHNFFFCSTFCICFLPQIVANPTIKNPGFCIIGKLFQESLKSETGRVQRLPAIIAVNIAVLCKEIVVFPICPGFSLFSTGGQDKNEDKLKNQRD
ncbi:MAG: hypothetical protein EBT98_09710 [Opitutaceae bacterium]|nr:hypothetical protein [Opitutaceae bacterium]